MTGAIYQRASPTNSQANFFRTNANNVISSTNLNSGILLFTDSGGGYGMDMAWSNANTWATRIFTPPSYDIVFSTGAGSPTSQSSFTDKMTIKGSTGYVGIGTLTPGATLDVESNANYQLTIMKTGGGGDTVPRILVGTTTSTDNWTLYTSDSTTTSSTFFGFYNNSGNQTVFKIYGNGNATLGGTLTQSSDRKLKTSILPLENSLHKINSLRGVSYYWKDPKMDQAPQIGLIAQEVQKIFPDLVKKDEKGLLSVNYIGLISPLVESVKSIYRKIILNDQAVAELKENSLAKDRRIQSLESTVTALCRHFSDDPECTKR